MFSYGLRFISFIWSVCLCNCFIQPNSSLNKKLFSLRYLIELNSIKPNILVSEAPNKRIDVYLSELLKDHSRSYYGNLCERGKVKVNSKTRDKAYKVLKGDIIEYEIEEKCDDQKVLPENIPLDILYEDSDILAINKPVGMVVHPAVGSPNGTFVNGLLYHLGEEGRKNLLLESENNINSKLVLEEEDDEIEDTENETDYDENDIFVTNDEGELTPSGKYPFTSTTKSSNLNPLDLPETPEAAKASPKSLRPGVVHRLDKGTSGVLLAAKHNDAVSKLSNLFAKRDVTKIYLAICVGHPGETTIVEPIGRCLKNRQMMTVYPGPPGKLAITHIKTIAFDGKLSACLVRIETGRTHQIRVHMKHRRTPIAGDPTYGNSDWNNKLLKQYGTSRPLLHAYSTSFIHPFTNQQINLIAPIPLDIMNVLSKLNPVSSLDFGLNHNTKDNNEKKLVDLQSGFLKCNIDVKESFGGVNSNGLDGNSNRAKGFVPYDRLVYDEEHFTSFDLPEELPDDNAI